MVNDRLMALRIAMLPKVLVIVQMYMPTSAQEDKAIEIMNENIIHEEGNVIMGDWNAVTGEGEQEIIMGNFKLRVINKRTTIVGIVSGKEGFYDKH